MITTGLYASGQPDFIVAFAAIYRSILSRFERYMCAYTTFGADCRKHFPSLLKAITTTVALLLPSCSALITTLGLIQVTPGCELRLLFCTKSETNSAILALEGLINIVHERPPFLISWPKLGRPWPEESVRNY